LEDLAEFYAYGDWGRGLDDEFSNRV